MFRSILRQNQAKPSGIKHVLIVGAGIMGSGIAQISAQSGISATLVNRSASGLLRAENTIMTSLKRVAKRKFANENERKQFVESSMDKITMIQGLEKVKRSPDLIIESVVEDVEIKMKIFEELEAVFESSTPIATNTSSFSLTHLSSQMRHPDRFGGLHFFNPVVVMKLVEIVMTENTSNQTLDLLSTYVRAIGKTGVFCRDTMGFIVNRLLCPVMFEAIRMAERGDSTMQDIDLAMKLGANLPMGPIKLADFGGLDTLNSILKGWHEKDPTNPLFQPIELLQKKVDGEKLGPKTGEGFYKYKK